MSNEINKKLEAISQIGSNIREQLNGQNKNEMGSLVNKAFIFGGAALILVWVFSKIFRKPDEDSKRKKKKKNNSLIFDLVKDQLGIIILALFRKQIFQLLKDLKLIDEKENI